MPAPCGMIQTGSIGASSHRVGFGAACQPWPSGPWLSRPHRSHCPHRPAPLPPAARHWQPPPHDHRRAVMGDRRAGRHRGGRCDARGPTSACRRNGYHRCTTGDQPPDMATASQAIVFQHRAFAGLQADGNAGHALAALDLGDGAAGFHADAQARARVGQMRRSRSARASMITGTLQPRLFQRNRGAVGIVVVGDNHGAITGRNGIVHHIVAHRRPPA